MRSAIALAATAIILVACPAARATDVDLSLSTHYSVGDYGGKGDVDIVYVPAVARFEAGAWTLKAIIPFLRISGGTTTVEGPTGPIETKNGTSEGLGDVVLAGSYTISPLASWAPFLEIGARTKLPTADEDQGLGTGEFDFTPELELARRYGRWTPFASVGFRVLGDASDVTYRDGLLASAGLMFRLFDRIEPGVFAYWKEAATKGADDAYELLPVLRVEVTEHWIVDAYASVGFTDSTPDAGGGLEIHYRIRDAL